MDVAMTPFVYFDCPLAPLCNCNSTNVSDGAENFGLPRCNQGPEFHPPLPQPTFQSRSMCVDVKKTEATILSENKCKGKQKQSRRIKGKKNLCD